MADKFSVLIKYKHIEYIKNAKLSDADSWVFMNALIEYDKTGNEPKFENPVLLGLFAAIKYDLDQNKEKWKETVKAKSEAGKKGAERRWGDNKQQDITSDNTNNSNNTSYQSITQITPVISDKEDITKITNITDSGYDSDIVSEFESGGGKSQPPPQISEQIKKEFEAQGFYIDEKTRLKILSKGLNADWLVGPHSFLEFCAARLRKKYPDKSNDELKPIFIAALLTWDDYRAEYPVLFPI